MSKNKKRLVQHSGNVNKVTNDPKMSPSNFPECCSMATLTQKQKFTLTHTWQIENLKRMTLTKTTKTCFLDLSLGYWLRAQQTQMKNPIKWKWKHIKSLRMVPHIVLNAWCYPFLGINKQTNIMMKNDAQMRNQSVNHFSIIQTSNTYTHTHSQKTKNRLTARIHTHTHTC